MADEKISQLPTITAPQNADLIPLVDSGTTSAITFANLFTSIATALASLTQTLTNKTIAAASNTITGLTNANLSGTAGVSNANLATMAATTLKGNSTGGSATPTDLSVAAVQSLLNIPPNPVPNANLAAMAANTVKANNTGGSTTPSDLTVAQMQTMLSIPALPVVTGNGGTGTGTTFTAGSLVFAGVSGVYTQNNAELFWDNTNFRLGINNATPGNRFNVNTPVTADALATVLLASSIATNKCLVLQGFTSQSANLMEFQSSAGTLNGFITNLASATFVNIAATTQFQNLTSSLTPAAPQDAFICTTGTPATSGVPVSITKGFHLEGNGWDTSALISRQTDWQHYSVPISGNPVTGSYVFRSQVAGGGYLINFTINSGTGGCVSAGPMTATHFIGGSSTPTLAAGAGAGTGPAVSITGSDTAGIITVTTGTLPTAAAVIATATFNKAFASAPNVVFSASNANAAGLGGVTGIYATSTTTTLVLNAGATALTAATTYVWTYVGIQ